MITVREAKLTDIPEIRELFQQTVLHVTIKDYSPEQTKAWAARGDDFEVWRKRINSQYFIVAENKNKITGFAALRNYGCLNSLFVHKNFQHQGIASALLANIQQKTKKSGFHEITAEVSITAKPFFESKNFMVVREQIVNIGVEVINYLMYKNL